MYISPNYPSKAAIKRALEKGVKFTIFQPNNMFGVDPPRNGKVTLEGPHYPKPHCWYGTGIMKDGYLVKIT